MQVTSLGEGRILNVAWPLPDVPPDPVIVSKEEMIADALASMTADERTAARAAACKGWRADFSGTFFKGTGTVSSKGSMHAKAPTWSEKPNPKPTLPVEMQMKQRC